MPTLFGGDPRQIMNAKCHVDQLMIVNTCIHSSPLWIEIQQICVTEY